MSPWTKRLQRSTRSFAPFSGWLFHWACASLIQIIGNAAAAAPPANGERLTAVRSGRALRGGVADDLDHGPARPVEQPPRDVREAQGRAPDAPTRAQHRPVDR